MGNACTINNDMCMKNTNQNEKAMYLILAKEVFQKDLSLEEEVKDVKKSELLIKVIQKIISYNNDNLIQHLINQQNKKTVVKFLQNWSRLKLQEIDMVIVYSHRKMYQNILVNNFEAQKESKKIFKQPKTIKRSNKQKIPEIFDHYIKKGKQLYQKQKISFVIFTPEFDNQKQQQSLIKNLAKVLIQILQNSEQTHSQIPFITIVTYPSLYIKIKQVLSKLGVSLQKYIIAVKRSNLIMDDLGRLCLKSSNSSDLIEKSFGNDDFLSLSFEGQSVSKILNKKNIDFVVAIQLEYFSGQSIDYFLWGYYAENLQYFDIVYKCQPFNPKKNLNSAIVKQIKQNNGKIHLREYPESDKQKGLFDWTQILSLQTPIKWQGYFIFHLPTYTKILQTQSPVEIRDFVKLKREKTCYWDPETKSYQMNKECTYFYKPLSNLFLRLDPNRTCGIEYEQKLSEEKAKKKPSNFDTDFF